MFQEFPKNPLENGVENLNNIISDNKSQVKTLLKIKNKTYSNFITPLMEMENRLTLFFTPISHIHSVENSNESKKIYGESLPILSEYSSEISQNLEIF